MGLRPKSLRCPNCNALLDVDRRLREGDVLHCDYCQSDILVEGCDRDTTRSSRRYSLTVINASYHDHRRYQTNEYNYYNTYYNDDRRHRGNSYSAPSSYEAWERETCDEIRNERQREQDDRKYFRKIATEILLIILPVAFIVAIAFPNTKVSVASFALCAICVAFLFAILCGAFKLRLEDMELAPDETRAPLSSDVVQNMPFQEVVDAFREAGFENVRPEALRDLGCLSRLFTSLDGHVSRVRIADASDFEKGSIFRKSEVIHVRYHSRKPFALPSFGWQGR